MSRHDDLIRLRDMLDHASEAVDMCRGRTRSDRSTDRMLSLATIRLLEIVGEAASRTSEQTRLQHQGVPWIAIAGLRNRLIHGYGDIDYDIVWEVVEHDLPKLIQQLRSILSGTS